MRCSLFFMLILLLTGRAAALDLQVPTDAVGVPLPVGQNSLFGARILSDAEITGLIPTSTSALTA